VPLQFFTNDFGTRSRGGLREDEDVRPKFEDNSQAFFRTEVR
jgi:hypothetical protein